MKSLFGFKHWFVVLNIVVILIAALLRLPYLDTIPPLMLQDEAATGFNAISIALTGKDEWGINYPTIFRSFGDNKPPVYIYVTALVYKLIGWSPILPRIASAIAGILLVLVVSLWLKRVLKSAELALMGALITAVSPWTIYLSRMGLESNLGLLFFSMGLLFLEYAKEKNRLTTILSSSLFFILSAYTYHSYRLITGVFLFCLLGIKIINKSVKNEIISLLFVSIIAAAGILPGVLSSGSLTRFQQTSVIQTGDISSIFQYFRGTCHLMSADINILPLRFLCTLLWNQTSIKMFTVAQSIVNHLSPDFLFFKGDSTLNRNPISQGEFYIILFPFFLLGIFKALLERKKYAVVVVGLIIAAIPSILTGTPHSIRLSAQIPFVIFLIILGLKYASKYFKYTFHVITVILVALTIYSITKFSLVVYSESQQFLSHSQQISKLAYRYYQKGYSIYYDQEILPEPHIFFAFWNNFNPEMYQQTNKIINTDEMGFIRPSQIGDRLFFYRPEINKIICNSSITDTTIFITNQSLPFTPESIFLNNTKVHQLAALYDSQSIRDQKFAFSQYCK